MAAATYNITIDENSTFQMQLQLKEEDGTTKDLTGWTAVGSVKYKATDIENLMIFSFDYTNLATGKLMVVLPTSETSSLNLKGTSFKSKTTAQYSIAIKQGDTVIRLLQGLAYLIPEV